MTAQSGKTRSSHEKPAKRFEWEEAVQRNDQIFTLLGGNEGYEACTDDKQDKALPSSRHGLSHLPAVRAGFYEEYVRGQCDTQNQHLGSAIWKHPYSPHFTRGQGPGKELYERKNQICLLSHT